MRLDFADFNTCVYADGSELEPKHKKAQRFVGSLPGLRTISGRCKCPKSFEHPKVIGKDASSKSARYPRALCIKYAELLVNWWLKDGVELVTRPLAMEETVREAPAPLEARRGGRQVRGAPTVRVQEGHP